MVLCSHLELVPDTKLCHSYSLSPRQTPFQNLSFAGSPEKSGIALELIKMVSTQGSCAHLSAWVQGLDGARIPFVGTWKRCVHIKVQWVPYSDTVHTGTKHRSKSSFLPMHISLSGIIVYHSVTHSSMTQAEAAECFETSSSTQPYADPFSDFPKCSLRCSLAHENFSAIFTVSSASVIDFRQCIMQ